MSFLSSTIKNILSHGIALNLESEEEEEFYVSKMQEYFEEKTEFMSYLRGNKIIEVESQNMELAMEITVQQSTLYMMPYVAEVFDIFTEVLKFIANEHKKVMNEFRGTEESRIESITELTNMEDYSDTEELEGVLDTEEPSSDDDYEWI